MQKSEPTRVLFVNSEIYPYLPETYISTIGRYLPQGIQECKKEIKRRGPPVNYKGVIDTGRKDAGVFHRQRGLFPEKACLHR